MNGMRPLSQIEQDQVIASLKLQRDKTIFILGLKTGFRISELLSLKVGDVYQDGQVVGRIRVLKRNTKTKQTRELPLHTVAKESIQSLLGTFKAGLDKDMYLFQSREGINQSIDRTTYHKILASAIKANKIMGRTSTHSMRKTFAKAVYERLNYDLVSTCKALGHSSILNTVRYIDFDNKKIDDAILA